MLHATNLAIVPLSFVLTHGDVQLRVIRMRDVKALERVLLDNRGWLKKWEATLPEAPRSFDVRGMVRNLLRSLDDRNGVPFVIQFDGEVVGQLNVANILCGSVSSAVIGYWVSEAYAGKSIAPISVALATDYLFNVVGLHRVEIAIRPENLSSLRVVEKLGFRYEGLKQNYIHIDGAFRDHYIFALTHEEVYSGVLNRWLRQEVPTLNYPWNAQLPKD
jgi:ribosomal-protein-alanine N-acetyltransferase